MDYEQKYNKLVNAIKLLQEANPSDEGIQNWVNNNVPELAESEGERIKKEIIEIVMQPTWKTEKEFHRRKELCDWIEKQGQKSAWSEEDEENFKGVMDALNFCNHEGINPYDIDPLYLVSWLKSIKQRMGG